MAQNGHGAMSDLSPLHALKQTSTSRRRCRPTHLSQDLRAKRDSKLTYLTAWIASFVLQKQEG